MVMAILNPYNRHDRRRAGSQVQYQPMLYLVATIPSLTKMYRILCAEYLSFLSFCSVKNQNHLLHYSPKRISSDYLLIQNDFDAHQKDTTSHFVLIFVFGTFPVAIFSNNTVVSITLVFNSFSFQLSIIDYVFTSITSLEFCVSHSVRLFMSQ